MNKKKLKKESFTQWVKENGLEIRIKYNAKLWMGYNAELIGVKETVCGNGNDPNVALNDLIDDIKGRTLNLIKETKNVYEEKKLPKDMQI